jgi:hypothetical protein
MIFKEHLDLKGKHAIFSPSQSYWTRYSDEKIADKLISVNMTQLGTEIHEFAASQIYMGAKVSGIRNLIGNIKTYIFSKYEHSDGLEYGLKLIRDLSYFKPEVYETIKEYINDAIGFGMTPEQILYFSDNVFGTADTISFRDQQLRIHDLKTGQTPAHMEQLMCYAALFCLEYGWRPYDISIELRLYQLNEVLVHNPEPEEIEAIIESILRIEKIKTNIDKNESKLMKGIQG